MSIKRIRTDDLTGAEIHDERGGVAQVTVTAHPQFVKGLPVTLDADAKRLADRLAELVGEERVELSVELPSGTERRYVLAAHEFGALGDPEVIKGSIWNAIAASQRGARRAKPQRSIYRTLAGAGLPHRGAAHPEEAALVREHLDEVNANRRRHNLKPIDPADPKARHRYGFAEQPDREEASA